MIFSVLDPLNIFSMLIFRVRVSSTISDFLAGRDPSHMYSVLISFRVSLSAQHRLKTDSLSFSNIISSIFDEVRLVASAYILVEQCLAQFGLKLVVVQGLFLGDPTLQLFWI